MQEKSSPGTVFLNFPKNAQTLRLLAKRLCYAASQRGMSERKTARPPPWRGVFCEVKAGFPLEKAVRRCLVGSRTTQPFSIGQKTGGLFRNVKLPLGQKCNNLDTLEI